MNGIKLLPLLILLLLVGCSQGKLQKENIISVTIEPQRYFAEKIAGDNYKINTVVPMGQSPEAYDPTPQQIRNIGLGVAYLQIGYIGFEQAWINNIKENVKDVRFFDLSKGVDLIIDKEEHDGHYHYGGIDPHIWSSVSGAKVIARNTLNAFIAIDPDNTDYYNENFRSLMKEIEETEAEINRLLSTLSSRTFIIYHPALTYFAHEYGLNQLCIEMDGKEPSPAQMKELIEAARASQAKVVFVQQEFDKKNAELIAKETDCRLVTINPLSCNWKQEMTHIAKALSNE